MQYLFDIFIVVFIIIFTVVGIKKGVVRSLLEFIGTIVAAYTASWLADFVSVWIYDTFFLEGVREKIVSVVSSATSQGTELTGYFTSLPDFIQRFLEINGITESSINSMVTGSGANIANTITTAISPVLTSIIKVFAVIVIFLLLMFLVKAIAGLVSGIFNLPILRQINGLLGGVFGFFMGTVILWLIIVCLSFFIPMMSSEAQLNVQSMINSSTLLKFFESFNPLASIL